MCWHSSPIEHRGFAYGIFNTVYGVAWLLGSTLMGLLYDFSILYLFLFVVVMEAISVIVFSLLKKEIILSEKQ